MKFFLLLLPCLFFFFSCSEDGGNSNFEKYQLTSQTVEIQDTTFQLDKNGNPTDKITDISTTSFPIRDNLQEIWTFSKDDLKISTQLSEGNLQETNYKVEQTEDGFFLKRENENQFCKIIKQDNNELILETRGRIVLKKIK